MSTAHLIQMHSNGSVPAIFWATCSCKKWRSDQSSRRWEVEDAHIVHTDQVQRALAALQRRAVGVSDQHAYFLKKAADVNETPENRALWRQLADGLESRLPVDPRKPCPEDVPLF